MVGIFLGGLCLKIALGLVTLKRFLAGVLVCTVMRESTKGTTVWDMWVITTLFVGVPKVLLEN